jgi:hypothetical protein
VKSQRAIGVPEMGRGPVISVPEPPAPAAPPAPAVVGLPAAPSPAVPADVIAPEPLWPPAPADTPLGLSPSVEPQLHAAAAASIQNAQRGSSQAMTSIPGKRFHKHGLQCHKPCEIYPHIPREAFSIQRFTRAVWWRSLATLLPAGIDVTFSVARRRP